MSRLPHGQLTDEKSFTSHKSRVPQNIIISLHLDRIQNLLGMGWDDSLVTAVKGLHHLTKNIHDDAYTESLTKRSTEITRKAKKIFPLKPSDYRTQSDSYQERQAFIFMEYHRAMYEELMLCFQRQNVLPAKSMQDAEIDINEVDIG